MTELHGCRAAKVHDHQTTVHSFYISHETGAYIGGFQGASGTPWGLQISLS